jgi:glucokinase
MSRHVLAVDLGGTKCSAAAVDKTGRIARRSAVAVDLSSPSAPVLQICRLAEELAGRKAPSKAFLAAGIAVPGLVRQNGTVWAPNLPGWHSLPLASRLRRRLGIPIAVESDRIAALIGECWRGAGRGKSDLILLTIGTGIGAGILSGGQIVRGAHELSGCAGWLTVTREEVPEAFGRGELECLVSGPAIARSARQRLHNGEESILCELRADELTAQQVATAARQGDRVASDIFNRAGRFLGFAVANLISLFDPQVVVISGGMAGAADLYLRSLRAAMVERAQPLAAKQVKIVVSRLGEEANLLGCASLVFARRGRDSS